MSIKTVALIPHYRHIKTLPAVVSGLRKEGLPVIVVDDGSGEQSRDVLEQLRKEDNNVEVLFLSHKGKGAALKHGLKKADERGFTHVLCIDADGQHNIADVPKMLELAEKFPLSTICANPIYSGDAPKSRVYGRKLTNFWNVINTWSLDIKDGMCGFRVYPVVETCTVLDNNICGDGMDFDNEILVRLYNEGVPIYWLDSEVSYPSDGVSHFDMRKDNALITKMHARLFFAMLKNKPKPFIKNFYERHFKNPDSSR